MDDHLRTVRFLGGCGWRIICDQQTGTSEEAEDDERHDPERYTALSTIGLYRLHPSSLPVLRIACRSARSVYETGCTGASVEQLNALLKLHQDARTAPYGRPRANP